MGPVQKKQTTSLQLHLQAVDLLEQLRLFGLPLLLVLGLLPPREELAGTV